MVGSGETLLEEVLLGGAVDAVLLGRWRVACGWTHLPALSCPGPDARLPPGKALSPECQFLIKKGCSCGYVSHYLLGRCGESV